MLKKILSLSIVLLLLLPATSLTQSRRKISLLIYNGKVFAADAEHSIYEAAAIDKERIVAVGTTAELRGIYSADTEIDLKGKLVTPGFNDAHIHFLSVGLALLRVDLNGSKTLEEAKTRIAAKIKELPRGAWVLGRGWDHTLWENRLPTRQDLDDISPDNPVFTQRVDGHIAWANTLALRLAKVTKDTKDPEGGEIVRESDGGPAGVLKETAQVYVSRVVPPTSREDQIKGLELAMKEAARYGLTSVQDGSGFEATKLYAELLRKGTLTVRPAVWQGFDDSVEKLEAEREEFLIQRYDPNRLKLGILKGYMDGTLGSRTAAMIEPFSDDPGNKGIPRRPAKEMIDMIVERDAAGFQIGLHSIGDQANRTALEGFSAASKANGWGGMSLERRHRIEHAQVVAPSDFKKYADLGIIASMQPTHAITDKRWAPYRLGEYRVLGAYSWHTFQSYGVHVSFGTDAPVEPLNTYLTLYAAVTRQSPEGVPVGGWLPQEKLTIENAIRNYTYESAYAEFAERHKGTIGVGMLADMVVHSKDLLTIDPREILATEPVYTIFNGRVIYLKK